MAAHGWDREGLVGKKSSWRPLTGNSQVAEGVGI